MALIVIPSSVASELVVIAHPSTPVKQLSVPELRRIFTMRQTRWSDGQAIRVFVSPSSSITHNQFCREALGMFPYQLSRRWQKLVYSGTGVAPVEVDQQKMLSWVSSTPGAIGYIKKVETNDDVKVVALVSQ